MGSHLVDFLPTDPEKEQLYFKCFGGIMRMFSYRQGAKAVPMGLYRSRAEDNALFSLIFLPPAGAVLVLHGFGAETLDNLASHFSQTIFLINMFFIYVLQNQCYPKRQRKNLISIKVSLLSNI